MVVVVVIAVAVAVALVLSALPVQVAVAVAVAVDRLRRGIGIIRTFRASYVDERLVLSVGPPFCSVDEFM